MQRYAAIVLYREQLKSLATVRERCAALLPPNAGEAERQRMRLVLEIIGDLEVDATARLNMCLAASEP